MIEDDILLAQATSPLTTSNDFNGGIELYKKYSIFSIEVLADNINEKRVKELELLTSENNFYIDLKKSITINIPMITS